jgi:MGT family glycosyltransferase
MSTVIFYSLPFVGHINPALPLVAELVQRGEQVFFYATEDFQGKIESSGAVFRSYGPLDLSGAPLLDNPFKVCELYFRSFPEIVSKCLPEAREIQPDYIMHDTTIPWGTLIAEQLQVPSVGSQAVLLIKSEMLLFNIPMAAHMMALYMTARQEARSIAHALKTVADTYHTQSKPILESIHYNGDLTIVYTSRAFQPWQHLFKENFVFIGPSISDRNEQLDFPLERLGDRPIIYISLGTLFNKQPDFFRTCLQAFADTDYQVVLSTGRGIHVEELGPLPENFLAAQYVPQLPILSRAALFINHAGINSVLEAFWYGVPMLMFPPTGGDHPWVAQCVAKVGAGKVYRKPRITASKLRSLAESVLTPPSYARASERIGESLHVAGGVSKAADAIEELKRRKNISRNTDPISLG